MSARSAQRVPDIVKVHGRIQELSETSQVNQHQGLAHLCKAMKEVADAWREADLVGGAELAQGITPVTQAVVWARQNAEPHIVVSYDKAAREVTIQADKDATPEDKIRKAETIRAKTCISSSIATRAPRRAQQWR
jgi:hypothetical protein